MSEKHYRIDFEKTAAVLFLVFGEGFHFSRAVNEVFKGYKVSNVKERLRVLETAEHLIRYWRRYWSLLGQDVTLTEEYFYQLYLLSQYVSRGYWSSIYYEKPDELDQRILKMQNIPLVWESFPDEFGNALKAAFPDKYLELLKSLNLPAPTSLRVNTYKANPEEVLSFFKGYAENIVTFPDLPEAILLDGKYEITRLDFFKEGKIEYQDISSQKVARLLDPQPGQKVWDVCAGAGGKSLHLAALMKNKGKVFASDQSPFKLKELKTRAVKAGTDCIEVHTDGLTKILANTGKPDAILIDAPCSGSGTFASKPDARWRFTMEALKELTIKQSDLLENYAPIVSDGGSLVYAVCSFLPQEGEELISSFINRHPEFEVKASFLQLPGEGPGEGFFACKLLKRQ